MKIFHFYRRQFGNCDENGCDGAESTLSITRIESQGNHDCDFSRDGGICLVRASGSGRTNTFRTRKFTSAWQIYNN